MEYRVLAILKNSKGKTLGIRITDGNNDYDVYKARLVNWYKNSVKFSNAILYANGSVRAKRGNLPIIVLREEKHTIRKNTTNVEDKVILYHGSETGIVGHVDIKYSNRLCDFGYGFYTSNDKRQAINRVCNYANSRLYTIELDLSGASIYKFTDETLWALYIGVNRGKIDLVDYPKLKKIINYINSHDIIIGLIADDKIGNCYSMFLDNYITNEALCKCLSYVKFGNQLVIKNQKFCRKNKLKIIEDRALSKEEKREALAWGKGLKESMDLILEDVRISYNKQGRFAKEILKKEYM